MQFNPPSACIVEINIRGVKIIVQDDCQTSERVRHIPSYCTVHAHKPLHITYLTFEKIVLVTHLLLSWWY